MGLRDLPTENLDQIFLFMDIAAMLNLCSTSKEFDQFCQNDTLWMIKMKQDYGVVVKPEGFTWRRTYFEAAKDRLRQVDVSVGGQIRGQIWYSVNQSIATVITEAIKRYPNGYRYAYLVFEDIEGESLEIVIGETSLDKLSSYPQSIAEQKLTLMRIELSDVKETRVTFYDIRSRRIVYYWLREDQTIGGFLDEANKFVPGFTHITAHDISNPPRRVLRDYTISNSPESRVKNFLEATRSVGIVVDPIAFRYGPVPADAIPIF